MCTFFSPSKKDFSLFKRFLCWMMREAGRTEKRDMDSPLNLRCLPSLFYADFADCLAWSWLAGGGLSPPIPVSSLFHAWSFLPPFQPRIGSLSSQPTTTTSRMVDARRRRRREKALAPLWVLLSCRLNFITLPSPSSLSLSSFSS